MHVGKNPQGGKSGEERLGVKTNFKKQGQPVIKHKDQIGKELVGNFVSSAPAKNKKDKGSYDESLHLVKFHATSSNSNDVTMLCVPHGRRCC